MRAIILILALTVFFSCHSTGNKAGKASVFVEGYWIPEHVKWLSPKSGMPEIDTIVRYANFQTLCFDNKNRFYVLQSTQSFPKGHDSLIFESEPGIRVHKGKWRVADSGKIMLEYKVKKGSLNTITVQLPDTAKSLFFNGITYRKTTLYDRLSKRKLDACKDDPLLDLE